MTSRIKLLLLLMPSILASATLGVDHVSSYRIPAYVISILMLLCFGLLRLREFALPAVLIWILIASVAASEIVNQRDLATAIRQVLVYSSLFLLVGVGQSIFRFSQKRSICVFTLLAHTYTLLFIYGIYTYYAQLFNLAEPLLFLRPAPVIQDGVDRFSQGFVGWLGSARAYSVWYEPSYSSIALACALPLAFLVPKRSTALWLVITACLFAVLTYSRSAWAVAFVFLCWLFAERFLLSRRRMSKKLLLIVVSILPCALLVSQLAASGLAEDSSSWIRSTTNQLALEAILSNPVVGTASPVLHRALNADGEYSTHIHNSFLTMAHWVGVWGVLVLAIPVFKLVDKASRADDSMRSAGLSFIVLSIVAFTIGGHLAYLSIFWVTWGIYFAGAQSVTRSR